MATPASSGLNPEAAGTVDVRYYAHLLWRGRFVVVAAVTVSLVVGIFFAYLQTPEYQAAAMLQIEPPTPTFLSVTDALVGAGNYWQNADFYNTQFKVLRSRTIGDLAVKRLKLTDQPPFKDDPDPAGRFMTHVSIEPVPDSRLVMVQVTHPDPREAALWANTLAEVYVEQTLAQRVEAARKAYEWLQDRLAATQQNMRDAQMKLLKGMQEGDIAFTPDVTGNGGPNITGVASPLARLSEDYVTAQGRRIALEAALKQVAQMQAAGQGLDTLPQVVADPVVLNLNNQMATLSLELSRLKEKFKEAHPEVQRVQAQLDQIRQAKVARSEQITQSLQSEYAQEQKREAQLRSAIEQQKALAASQSRKSTELEALRKESDSAKNLYEVLLQKLNETDIAASIRSNNVSVVETARAPLRPVRPVKVRFAATALMIGLVLGVGLVLGRDLLENTIKNPEEIESYLHLDLLATVPHYDAQNVNLVTEAYQNLRTALIFARRNDGGQVVLVTGTAPQEGKTTTVVNLAKLLAGSGERAVAVDFDLRRAQLHDRLAVPREPGTTSYFVSHTPVDGIVKPTRVENLFVIPAGPLPPNPPALLARQQVPELLTELRARFDWVLLDSPPLASVTDALLLARHADLVIYVVEHNHVDKRVIKRAVTALLRVSGNVLGAVLNGVDVKTRDYYYRYYHDYSSTTDDQAEAGERTAVAPLDDDASRH